MDNNKPKFGVYQDINGRTLYFNYFYKNAFIINKKDEKKFNLYANRFVVPVLAFIIFISLEFNVLTSTIAFVFSLFVMSFMFHKSFLKSLSTVEKYELKPKQDKINKLVNTNQKTNLLVKALLFILIGILLPINAYLNNTEISYLVISSFLAIFVLYQAIIHLKAYLTK